MSVFTQKIDSIVNAYGIEEITERINQELIESGGADEVNDLVYCNQVDCAIRFIKSLDDNGYPKCNHKIIEGLTQAGKTGVYKAAIMFLKLYGLIPVLNIKTFYYVTGDNGKEMSGKNVELLRKCFLEDFGCNFIAMKNSELRNNLEHEHVTNSLLFIDECHWGVEDKKNVLIKWLISKDLDMHNDPKLVEKSVFIVSNSATPFSEEMSDIAGTKQVIKLNVDEWNGKTGYVGIKHYCANNAFVEYVANDSIKDDCIEIRKHLDEVKEKTGKEKVVIARIYDKRYKRVKDELNKYFKVKEFFSSNTSSIDYAAMEEIMLTGPSNNLTDKPIMIVVKGAYTMGIRIKPEAKKNIGAIYDVRCNCSGKKARKGIVSTIQGLLGRITGYWNSDDWKDIRIWVHECARVNLVGYYYEQQLSTPVAIKRDVFVPGDGDIIGIVPERTYTFSNVPMFAGNIKDEIVKYLENNDSLYSSMINAVGTRYTKTGHQTIPYFSIDDETEDIRIPENINKKCYTYLYSKKDHTIDVTCGVILMGKYVKVDDSNYTCVETLATLQRVVK